MSTETASTLILKSGTVSFDFQRLPTGPEMAWTRWWAQNQTSGRQQQRGLWGSPCETKQSTSCSVQPGRSFWLQFCLDRPQQSRDTERAARGNATHASTQACLLTVICTCAQWLSLHNDSLSFVAVMLGADEGTSCHIGERKLSVKMSHIVTNCPQYSGSLWLMPSI